MLKERDTEKRWTISWLKIKMRGMLGNA